METFLIILAVIFILILLSCGGWILRSLEGFLGIFFEGISNCFGCLLKFIVWIIAIIIIGMMVTAQLQ